MQKIVIVGMGGHGRGVADSIVNAGEYEIAGYTDLEEIPGCPYKYLGTDEALDDIIRTGLKYAAVGIGFLGRETGREDIYYHLKEKGFILPVIKDSTAIVSSNACVGEGTYIAKGAVVNTGASIGPMCIVNTAAIIEHDVCVDEFCHVSVSAVLCGGVKLGEGVFIGANATVIQGVSIEKNAVIGAGAIILSNVPGNQKVVGVWKRKVGSDE